MPTCPHVNAFSHVPTCPHVIAYPFDCLPLQVRLNHDEAVLVLRGDEDQGVDESEEDESEGESEEDESEGGSWKDESEGESGELASPPGLGAKSLIQWNAIRKLSTLPFSLVPTTMKGERVQWMRDFAPKGARSSPPGLGAKSLIHWKRELLAAATRGLYTTSVYSQAKQPPCKLSTLTSLSFTLVPISPVRM